jgi:argonaute-like protein implicated in RNA metabolism and viral defense
MSSLIGNKIKEEPNLLFDKTDTSASHPQVYWGLRTYGPYDKEMPNLKLAIVSPQEKMDLVRGIITGLNNGTPILPGGMPRFFRCKIEEQVKECIAPSTSVDDYEKAALQFLKSTDYKDIDVILVYIPKTSRYFTNTPYYRLKSLFTSHGFLTQMITQTAIDNLKWSYLNLATAIYAKAGRIPWVLSSEMKNTDMILGLSISNVVTYRNKAGGFPKFVGCANVFDNHGKWMFLEGTANLYERDKPTRLEQFKELVSNALEKYRAVKKTFPKNITIHYYKKYSKEEIRSAKAILSDVAGDCNLTCVSIDTSHPFRLYDRKTGDGSFPRGAYVYLGSNEALLSTTGETPIAGRRMGTPKLLDIKILQRANQFLGKDGTDEIVNQVFALTKLDWATATPMIREPVTLQFSRAIAYLTAAMSEQEWKGITSSEVSPILNNRPWFI